jgi:simple sugar transport system substrate-binding protein
LWDRIERETKYPEQVSAVGDATRNLSVSLRNFVIFFTNWNILVELFRQLKGGSNANLPLSVSSTYIQRRRNMRKNFTRLAYMALALMFVLSACGGSCSNGSPCRYRSTRCSNGSSRAAEAPVAEPFVFGMLLVGPYNDNGWSQAHYEAGKYLEEKLGAKMLYLDKVNPADRPGTTPDQLAEELVAQGAKLVIFNSDDMKDASTTFAKANPDVFVIMASGDQVWPDGKAYEEIPNLMNIMGRMEYGKMMAGCAAALASETGKIGYLGPLINDETRRLAASAYLGAKHCWETAGNDPAALEFKVTWIGFWFNIPGVTLDPVQVSNDFYTTGYDVVISGIDNPVNLGEAQKLKAEGNKVFWRCV